MVMLSQDRVIVVAVSLVVWALALSTALSLPLCWGVNQISLLEPTAHECNHSTPVTRNVQLDLGWRACSNGSDDPQLVPNGYVALCHQI
jgi:hypothetical protein